MSMSIVEPVFCEFPCPRCSSAGLIRREMSLVVTADFIALFARNAMVRFYLEIRVTGYARVVQEKPEYERHTVQSILSASCGKFNVSRVTVNYRLFK